MDRRRKNQMEDILDIKAWPSPGKYLGLPAEWGKSKNDALHWIKERVMAKVEDWKGMLLNQAGKEVLIKLIIQAIPSYAMSVISFPKTFCKKLNSLVANFWWRGSNGYGGVHWRTWSLITKKKKEGGLGFRDFHLMNIAYLGKQAWRLLKNPQSLWGRILKGIYFHGTDFLHAKKGARPSWAWTSLIIGRDFLKKEGRWQLASGDSVDLWEDNWLVSGINLKNLPHEEPQTVSNLILPGARTWNLDKRIQSLRQITDNFEIHLSYLYCVLWIIWKNRSHYVYTQNQPSPVTVIQQSNRLHGECLENLFGEGTNKENSHHGSNRRQSVAPWRPPPARFVKVNVDASWDPLSKSGALAVVIRDSIGVIQAGSSRIASSPSPLVAEALAARDGIVLAMNLGFQQILLESDCLNIVSACRKAADFGEISGIIQDILTYKERMVSCGFLWVHRTGNLLAHEVAKAAAAGSLPTAWPINIPPFLRPLLTSDADSAARENAARATTLLSS
ncbi:Ribonuclease H domain [Sesbania bispinosa]|nr:Ribonuclease H domain [Sesbania bispinosa]